MAANFLCGAAFFFGQSMETRWVKCVEGSVDFQSAFGVVARAVGSICSVLSSNAIPFCQPGGKGCAVRFPPDAIEQAKKHSTLNGTDEQRENELSGPKPAWMTNNSQSKET